MAKEEDPEPFHQLYKLQIKSTQSTRQTFDYGIYKKTMRGPTKENTLALTDVDIRRTHRKEHTRISSLQFSHSVVSDSAAP